MNGIKKLNFKDVFSLFAAAFLLSACSVDNVPDCLKYVDAYNEAYSDCELPDRLNEEDACSVNALNDGRDCIAHYQYLTKNYECVSGRVTHNGEAPACTNIPEAK